MAQANPGQLMVVRAAARRAAAQQVAREGAVAQWPVRHGLFDAPGDLDHFTRRVAHDLRGPLYGMSTLSSLCRQRLAEGDVKQVGQWMSMIEQHSHRLGDMVSSMLDLLHVGAAVPTRTPVSLGELVAALRLEQPAPPAVVLRVQPLPVLRVDPALMSQVFARLLDNAFKFTRETPRPRIDLRCENLGRHWRFQVRDNGCGFAPERVEELFHPFARLHGDDYPGAGMGLAVVRHIVELHGGQVWADTQPGRGATFSFTLPA